jgi:tetratricopeptide (TPR) repeat protein
LAATAPPLSGAPEPARARKPAPPADLERAEASLQLAEERYAEADYDAAAAAAGSVRAQLSGSDTPPARQLAARAAAVEALCHAGRRRSDEAVAAFRTALELDPGFELDSGYASPRVTPLLEEARTRPTP